MDTNNTKAGDIERGQFLHVDKFAVTAPRGKANANDIWKIAAEAERREGSCPHVENPEPPRLLLGVMPSKAATLAEAWARTVFTPYTTRSGKKAVRKYRPDQPCALVGVISAPPQFWPEAKWRPFVGLALKWLRDHYQDRLRCVVQHLDEPQPHLHFWVVPRDTERFASIHSGVRALERVGSSSKRKVRDGVYKSAMGDLQDSFFAAVGQPSGLLRTSVGGQRFTPEQQNARQVHAALQRQRAEEAELAVAAELAALEQRLREAEQALVRHEDHARESGGPVFGPDGVVVVFRALSGSYGYRAAPRRNPGLLDAARERQRMREEAEPAPRRVAARVPVVAVAPLVDVARPPRESPAESARERLAGTPFERESPWARPRPRPRP